MSKVAPRKKESLYTWRVRRKTEAGDTPWKSGGPDEIMTVVLRRLEMLENFEASTKEIERRVNILDKNIASIAQSLKPRQPGEPLPPEPVIVKPGPSPILGIGGAKVGIKHETLIREKLATTGTLLSQVQAPAKAILPQKVSVIGAGPLGVNLAFAILNQGIASEIALVDADERRLKAEAMDMQYGMGFVKNSRVQASTDFAVAGNSRLVVLTVGQGDGKSSQSELAKKNIAAFKLIIPKILTVSPQCVLLVVSNPVDVMTYAAWKISGLPPHRIIGSGTNLDSNRFRGLIADKLKVNPSDCQGWIIGEQGPNSIPAWSGVNVAGVNLRSLNPKLGGDDDDENWCLCHMEVMACAVEISLAKRSASLATAMSLASLVRSLLHNNREVFSVSTLVKGYHGLAEEVFLSLPCVLGDHGICDVVKQTLSPEEIKKLKEGAGVMKANLATMQF